MRVLFVNENIGGHATVHHHLRRSLAEHRTVEARFLDVPPARLFRRLLGAPIPGLARLDADLQPLRAQLALSAWVRRRLPALTKDADVVHMYTHNAGLLSARLLAAKPLVVALDTTGTRNAYRLPYRQPTRFTPIALRLTLPFERRLYRAATLIVAGSEWAATSLREDYGVTDEQIRIVRFGVDMPVAMPAAAPGTSPGAAVSGIQPLPRIVFVGRQFAGKGGNRLWRIHQEQFAHEAELVLVTQESVPAGVNVTVINDLTPGDGRLWGLLRSAALFVFPSIIDQAPNAVLEAMSAGLPVIALDVSALGEMVLDGVTGRLVPPSDDAALSAAIAELLRDPQRRMVMGAAGRAHAETSYDAAKATSQLLAVLEEACHRHAEAAVNAADIGRHHTGNGRFGAQVRR